MEIALATLSPLEAYRTLIQTIIPRPVAWTLTANADETYNLAPFSYFNVFNSDPPTVFIGIGRKQDGVIKDTRRNLEERHSCVIHIASAAQASAVTATSLSLPAETSEVEVAGLNLAHDLEATSLPRVVGPQIALIGRWQQTLPIGRQDHGVAVVHIEAVWADPSVVESEPSGRLRFRADRIAPLGRLGGDDYVAFGDIVTTPRPPYEP